MNVDIALIEKLIVMKKLIEEIQNASVYELAGYSDMELQQIERLYDICINDDFELMLKNIGRSCGCALSGGYTNTEVIIDLYCSKNVRQQVISQYEQREKILNVAFREMKEKNCSDLTQHRFFKWVGGKPYFLSLENQTQHFLILTEEGGGYPVYRYDENTEDICSINCDLKDYMRCVINLSLSKLDARKWIGEMLVP